MGKAGCAVYNCEPSKTDGRHRFPHPAKNLELFMTWMQVLGNTRLSHVDNGTIYENYRVCSKHFVDEDFGPNNCLKKNVYPKLFLPRPIPSPSSPGSNQPEDHQRNELPTVPGCHGYHHDHTYCAHQLQGPEALSPSRTPPPASEFELPNLKDCSLLTGLNVRNVAELTPRASFLYKRASYYKKMQRRCFKQKETFRERLKLAEKLGQEQSLANLAKNLTSAAYNFFKNQIACALRKPKGRRFSIEDKVMALALYKQSPAAYRFLATLFALPSRVTLQKLLARIPIQPGINEAVFDGLRNAARGMNEKNRMCLLLFDEMSLLPNLHYNQNADEIEGFQNLGHETSEKIANHVQVFMLRGIVANWKQPVAYTFVNGGMKGPQIVNMIKNVVRSARKAGFKVIGSVCDQGANNVNAINDLVKNTQRKFKTNDYVFDIDGEKIIPIYDCPHLLKSLRNNLLSKDIYFEDNGETRRAQWKHIYNTWKLDSFSGSLKAMPKITESHVNPAKINKMKVSTCAQVFSHTMASTMNLLIEKRSPWNDVDTNAEYLTREAKDTAIFIKIFNDLFDSVNGSVAICRDGRVLRTSVPTNRNSVHVELWKRTLPMLQSMYILKDGKKTKLPCFKNWQITLKGMLLLRNCLSAAGVQRMKPRRFNQDPLENFFGKIRQRGQRFTNPTCTAFTAFYKTLLINTLMSKHSLGANCENDNTNTLVTLQQFITQGVPEEEQDDESSTCTPLVCWPERFDVLKPLTSAALSYVAGYIIKVRGQLNKNCVACKYNVLKRAGESDAHNCLLKSREYGGKNPQRLQYCNNEFVINLTKTYNITKHILKCKPSGKRLLKFIVKTVRDKVNFNFIKCEHSEKLLQDIVQSFCKLIIFNHVKGINNVMKGKDDRPLPHNVCSIFKQARDICIKRKKYKSK